MKSKKPTKHRLTGAELQSLKSVQKFLSSRSQSMVTTLQRLVEMESPSSGKATVDLLGAVLASEFAKLGGAVTVHAQPKFGDHLQIDFPGASNEKPVMLLGHFDTVWDIGTLEKMPFKLAKGRAFGPGVYDMKAGIVMMMNAIAALQEVNGGTLPRPVTVWLVTDEEVGSESSRAITEALARQSAAVLVAEPAQGNGALKTWRKGVGDYLLRVEGKASHSGVDFEKGASAIVEVANQITRITKFTNLKNGITVNPGIVRGGTRVNVVAAEAEVNVDVRIMKMKDSIALEKKFRSLKPVNRKCKLMVTGGINRPPMERTETVLRLFRLAEVLSRGMGFKVREEGTGGGSDGNFTAALGIPTLDGLGGVGEGAHALHESILVDELPRRTALLAGLIAHAERGA